MSQDRVESSGVRFGCGFVFGLVFGVFSLSGFAFAFDHTEALILLGVAVACGYAAMRFGDRFWHWIAKWYS